MTSSYWLSRIDRVESVLAELRQYWPSCSVSAEFVAHMIRTIFCHINTVLLIVN